MAEDRSQANQAQRHVGFDPGCGKDDGQKSLEYVHDQGGDTVFGSAQAGYVGGAGVLAAVQARIDAAQRFGDDQPEGNGAEDIGKRGPENESHYGFS